MAGQSVIKFLNNDIPLDDPCWACDGNGFPSDKTRQDEYGRCDICHGTGWKLNDNGWALIKFINRHLPHNKSLNAELPTAANGENTKPSA